MSSSSPKPPKTVPPEQCLVRAVAEAMKADPALEAVRVDHDRRAISVATLGHPRSSQLPEELTDRIRRMEEASPSSQCGLIEGGGDCGRCAEAPAVSERLELTIQKEAGCTTIARVTCPTAPSFWRWRERPWPRIVPREVVLPEDTEGEWEWKVQLAAAGLCGGLGVAGLVFGAGAAAWLYPLAYLAGGWFTCLEVWERLRKGVVDVHFLMLAVAAGSAAIGAWVEGTTLLFLFSLSGGLEHYAMGRTQREIRSLFRMTPKTATLLAEDGREQSVSVESLVSGMRLRVNPGDQFPVDAEVVRGRTATDESMLTGEAVPVDKEVGDSVLGGTLNLWGSVEVKVLRAAEESALQKVIRLIQEAQHLKAPSQRFTDRFGTGYTYGILSLCLAMFLIWWAVLDLPAWISTAESNSAIYLTMTLLVVASPCALVLSIPSAILAAIAWGARRGILFRGGAAVEKLAEIHAVALDKTGTLTTGELQVEKVESFPAGDGRTVAEMAYALERLSNHPLARAVTRYGKQQGLPVLELEHFESVAGLGLRARHGSAEVRLGSREWFKESPHLETIMATPAVAAGCSEAWVACGNLVGRLLFRDDIRSEARDLIRELHRIGLEVIVLTGDRASSARALGKHLGLDDIRAELSPEAKVAAVRGLTEQGKKVAMVGDGVNDAPSLAAAHVGVAMGSRGADAALEQAEVVLMNDRLENFVAAVKLSQRARRIIRQNLLISLGTVIGLVGLALLARIPLTLGVVGHEGSTVLVVLNSLRLLTRKLS